MRRGDLAFMAILVGILGGGLFLDSTVRSRPAGTASPAPAMTSFVSSGWYCPAPGGADVQAEMITANLSRRPVSLRTSSIGGSSQSAAAPGQLLPRRSASVAVRDFKIPDATGLVETFGGTTSTGLMVLGKGKGAAISRCSPQPSARWLFASASTARGENHLLLIANPFREEAVVGVRLIGPDKDVSPARLKDLLVPALSQVSVNLSDYYVESAAFGLEVRATRGRILVSRYSQVSAGPGRGISLDLGVPAPANRWIFAGGNVPTEGDDSIVMINPGGREALVEVVFFTEGGRNAPPALAEIPVPAGRQIMVNTTEQLPRGQGYGVAVTSTNGVPVVAERRTAGLVDKNRSFETVFGVTSPATAWAVPVGSPAGGAAKLAIVNDGQSTASVSVSLLGREGESRLAPLAAVQVQAGRKVVVDVAPVPGGGGAAIAMINASRPVAVESSSTLGPPYADYAATPGLPIP